MQKYAIWGATGVFVAGCASALLFATHPWSHPLISTAMTPTNTISPAGKGTLSTPSGSELTKPSQTHPTSSKSQPGTKTSPSGAVSVGTAHQNGAAASTSKSAKTQHGVTASSHSKGGTSTHNANPAISGKTGSASGSSSGGASTPTVASQNPSTTPQNPSASPQNSSTPSQSSSTHTGTPQLTVSQIANPYVTLLNALQTQYIGKLTAIYDQARAQYHAGQGTKTAIEKAYYPQISSLENQAQDQVNGILFALRAQLVAHNDPIQEMNVLRNAYNAAVAQAIAKLKS